MRRKLLFAFFIFSMLSANTLMAMENIAIAGISASYAYTGLPIVPTPVLRDGMRTLKKDVDYTVECKNNVNVGTATVIMRGIGNYAGEFKRDFSISKARIVATIDGGQGKIYGKPDPKLTYKITSGELKGNDVMKGSLERQQGEDIGIYPIDKGTLTAGDNYELIVVKNNFKIDRAPLVVKPTVGQTKVYGQKNPDIKYTIIEGALAGKDVFTGALGIGAGENVGTYAISLGTLSAGKNYDLRLAPEQVSFEVLKADVAIKPNPGQSKVFGAPDPNLTYTIVSGELKNNDTFKGSLSRQSGEDVGMYVIRQGNLTLSNNYNLKVDTLQKFEIKRKTFEKIEALAPPPAPAVPVKQ